MRARLGLLVLVVALALGLFGSHLSAWLRVLSLSEAVSRGQGEGLFRSFFVAHAGPPRPPDAQELEGFLTAEAGSGLTWVVFLDPAGAVLASAGTPLRAPTTTDLEALSAGLPLVVGDARWMVASPPGPPLREGEAPPGAPDGPPPGALDGPPPGAPDGPPPGGGAGRPRLLVQYTPMISDELRATTGRDLVLSGLAGLALVGAALWMWRSAREADAARAAATEQRHLASLGEMSAVLAHEIRNPLAALKGHAQLLEESVDAASAVRARRVVDQAIRLEAITNELLDFARAGRVERTPVDMVALARDVGEEEAPGRVRVSGEAPPWPLDAPKVRAALRNLVRNGLQASQAGDTPDATVDIVVEVRDGVLVVRVLDRGHGLPAGGEERVFAPFYTTRVRGAGLGLAVVQRIVALHGGSVTAQDRPEGGAAFTLVFPEVGR